MVTVLTVVLVFGGLIFFHELGHFLAARALGIGVSAFSLGFGPRLFGWRGKKTDYRVSLAPLGGYVMLVGEQPGAELPQGFTQRESFSDRPASHRFLVIVAGAVFNIVLAWLIFCAEPLFVGKPLLLEDGTMPYAVQLGTIQPGSPAAEAGLQNGDLALFLDGAAVDSLEQVTAAVAASGGRTLLLSVERDGGRLELPVTPRPAVTPEGDSVYRIGVQLQALPEMVPASLGESLVLGSRSTVQATGLIADALARLVTGKESIDQLGGVILIAQEIGNASSRSVQQVFILMALLSVNLGLLNLLPIPVLDGGHALFLIIEMISRRKLPESVRTITSYAGLFFLIAVMALATYNDIMRLVS